MSFAKRAGIGLAVLLILVFVTLASWEPIVASPASAVSDKGYRAEIIRDEYGVPHIYGETDADVAFGVAIAHAEDDFFTLQDVVAMSRGRYGAIAGEQGAQIDYLYHLLDAGAVAQSEYPKLPAETRAVYEAYAAGLNRYADQHSDEVKLANLFPVNGAKSLTILAPTLGRSHRKRAAGQPRSSQTRTSRCAAALHGTSWRWNRKKAGT